MKMWLGSQKCLGVLNIMRERLNIIHKKDDPIWPSSDYASCFNFSSSAIILSLRSTSSSDKLCSFTYMLLGLIRHSWEHPRIYLCSFSSEQRIWRLHSGFAQFT